MSITEIKRRHTAEIVENGDAEKIASSFKEQNAVYPMPKFLKENSDKISAANWVQYITLYWKNWIF